MTRKPAIKCTTAAALALVLSFFCLQTAFAAKRSHRSGGRGGGVYLETPEPQTPIEHNNRGVELGNKGLWADAIREHELALAGDPLNQQFRTNLSAAELHYGDVLANQKHYYEAIKQYRGAMYVDPNNQVADRQLDACLRRMGKNPDDYNTRLQMADDANGNQDYETAIVEYRKCVKMTDDGLTHMYLGMALKKQGKVADAFDELKVAINKPWKDKTEQGGCHREIGDILKETAFLAKSQGRGTVGMKRLLNAGIEYRRAVMLNPLDTNAIKGLVEVSREAVAISPKSFDNHLTLAGAYLLSGDFERAQKEYETCWKLKPRSIYLPPARKAFHMAVVQSPLSPQNPAIVLKTLDKVSSWLQDNPNDAELWYIYGRGKESLGDRDTALKAYQKAAGINPYVNPDLAHGLSRMGDPNAQAIIQGAGGKSPGVNTGNAALEAQKAAQAAAEAQKKREEEMARQQIYTAIENKIAHGDVQGAQADLMQLVQKDPKDGHAWRLLGSSHEKAGDLDQAAVSYRQGANLGDSVAADNLRTINLSRVQGPLTAADKQIADKNYVGAASTLREGISIAPELPILHKKLAEVLAQLGDTQESKRELDKASKLESR